MSSQSVALKGPARSTNRLFGVSAGSFRRDESADCGGGGQGEAGGDGRSTAASNASISKCTFTGHRQRLAMSRVLRDFAFRWDRRAGSRESWMTLDVSLRRRGRWPRRT